MSPGWLLEKFPCDIPGDFDRFVEGAALGDEALHIIGCREIDTFRQVLYMKINDFFHREIVDFEMMKSRNAHRAERAAELRGVRR